MPADLCQQRSLKALRILQRAGTLCHVLWAPLGFVFGSVVGPLEGQRHDFVTLTQTVQKIDGF